MKLEQHACKIYMNWSLFWYVFKRLPFYISCNFVRVSNIFYLPIQYTMSFVYNNGNDIFLVVLSQQQLPSIFSEN